MNIARNAAFIAFVILAGALLGNALQWALPSQHLSDARGAIGTVQGLVTLLLALTLGLLIWTAYGVYAQQQAEAQTLGSQILQLDFAFDRYGGEAARQARALLRDELISSRARFWGGDRGTITYSASRAELRKLHGFLGGLKPETDEQKGALDAMRSLSAQIVETHFLMARQLRNPLPSALVTSVTIWAGFVFLCVGMTVTLNALAVIVELLGAVAVASAFFMILEFSQPYFGLFRIPPDGIDQVIAALGADIDKGA